MYKTLQAFSSIYIFTMVHYALCIKTGALGEKHFFELIIKKIFLICI